MWLNRKTPLIPSASPVSTHLPHPANGTTNRFLTRCQFREPPSFPGSSYCLLLIVVVHGAGKTGQDHFTCRSADALPGQLRGDGLWKPDQREREPPSATAAREAERRRLSPGQLPGQQPAAGSGRRGPLPGFGRRPAALPASARPGCRVSSAYISQWSPASRTGRRLRLPCGEVTLTRHQEGYAISQKLASSQRRPRHHKEAYVVTKNLTSSQRRRACHDSYRRRHKDLHVVTKKGTSSQNNLRRHKAAQSVTTSTNLITKKVTSSRWKVTSSQSTLRRHKEGKIEAT